MALLEQLLGLGGNVLKYNKKKDHTMNDFFALW